MGSVCGRHVVAALSWRPGRKRDTVSSSLIATEELASAPDGECVQKVSSTLHREDNFRNDSEVMKEKLRGSSKARGSIRISGREKADSVIGTEKPVHELKAATSTDEAGRTSSKATNTKLWNTGNVKEIAQSVTSSKTKLISFDDDKIPQDLVKNTTGRNSGTHQAFNKTSSPRKLPDKDFKHVATRTEIDTTVEHVNVDKDSPTTVLTSGDADVWRQTCDVKMAGIGELAITKPAPEFQANAVVDGEFKTIRLSDYRGKYVVIFFYPLDFTFVCPTEIIAFSDRVEEFRAIGCEVLACSTDSVYSHLAWVNTPRKQGGLGPMNIPLIADKTAEISKKYGCLKEDEGIAFRGLYIIDDKGNLRQITINDLPVGRSVDETLRLVQAFQFTDKHGEVCPAGWKPGKETMKPDPKGSKEYFNKAN